MSKSKRYFKLGSNAATFVDPKSGISLVNKQVVKVDGAKFKSSKRAAEALKGGHIEEADEDEYNEYVNGLTKEEKALLKKTNEKEEQESEEAQGEESSEDGKEPAKKKKKRDKEK